MGERDVVSWTAMLNGYLKIGLDEEVLKLFMDLIERDFQPNRFTLACLLNLCARRSDLALGKQIHTHVVKSKLHGLILDSSLVYFYSSCCLISCAFEVFNKMTGRDVVCWTTMITACAQQGLGYEALSMFTQMQLDGFHPNEFTFCSALKACGEEKALKFGRQLHGALVKKMLKHDVFVMSSLLGMYVKCGEVLDARKVFDVMSKRNTVTWTSMIAGYAQNGYGEEAIGLFRRMNRRRIFANYLTVVSILSACGLVGSLHLGKEIHAKILKSNKEKNVHIGTTLIWLYCRCGIYNYASKILEAMPVKDVVSWTAIISGHARLGNGMEALEFLNNMLWEGVEPNPFTYSSALKACTRIEAVREGKWLHGSANKALALSNVYVGSALIGLYTKCGLVKDAFQVFDNMPERNIVVWKTMIIGYARNSMCKEALQLLYRMQAEGVKMDDFTVATVLSACGDVKWDSERSSLCTLKSG
ncbi:pentatricopeptide repeat-containing protein At4g18520, chloroplastic [Aristolochia californica]|uniref:pentatricopeptide repeat-containing protein At4g18520, chloroplastic n=1 Tax=Aristolochia californica TaxID=171875 RepID=UPI0035E288F3